MTDVNLDETIESFLFREPARFLDEFDQKDKVWGALAEPLLAFRANLSSAIRVGIIPFRLAHSGVLDQRFNQLMIASKIHFRGTEEGERERQRRVLQRANEEMDAEMRDQEVIERHADSTLNVKGRHLSRPLKKSLAGGIVM
jgi:hypothetical protein